LFFLFFEIFRIFQDFPELILRKGKRILGIFSIIEQLKILQGRERESEKKSFSIEDLFGIL